MCIHDLYDPEIPALHAVERAGRKRKIYYDDMNAPAIVIELSSAVSGYGVLVVSTTSNTIDPIAIITRKKARVKHSDETKASVSSPRNGQATHLASFSHSELGAVLNIGY